jgi:hypothetical protein
MAIALALTGAGVNDADNVVSSVLRFRWSTNSFQLFQIMKEVRKNSWLSPPL